MSVYTSPDQRELGEILQSAGLGALIKLTGIQAGIENSNFFLSTDKQDYVLTIFESFRADQLPAYLSLQQNLFEEGFPVATAVPLSNSDERVLTLCGKPAVLFTRLKGESPLDPTQSQCFAIGKMLARLHLVKTATTPFSDNFKDVRWFKTTAEAVSSQLDKDSVQLLNSEIKFQNLFNRNNLPQGLTHQDLFRDNVLMKMDQVTGILDFYAACSDACLFDLAICINDWCSNEDGTLNIEKTTAALDGYQSFRQFKPMEKGAWPIMLRLAALRFWLSRLYEGVNPKQGELTQTKNARLYEKILRQRIKSHDANRRQIK